MEAGLTIKQVTERTGVPAATLRAWERRYGFPVPERTAGGHRRYPLTEVERLALAHDLVEQGWNAAAAVRQVVEGGAEAAPTASTVLTQERTAKPPTGPADVDTEVLVLVSGAVRRLLRASTPAAARNVLEDVVTSLGGHLTPAEAVGPEVLPIDVSLGVGDPTLVAADAYTLARLRLEAVLPSLVEDAQLVVDRLRALGAS